MNSKVIDAAVRRVDDHVALHELKSIHIIFHGGEPLLAGKQVFAEVIEQTRAVIGDKCKVHFALQTNGTLLDSDWLDFFSDRSIKVGLSIDGPQGANDRFRLDHRGDSSFDAAVRGLSLLSQPRYKDIRGGLLSVMHPLNEPIELFDWLCSWQAPQIDFLFPHYSHAVPPPFPFDPDSGYGFGVWLTRIFDKWYSGDMHQVKVRVFEDIMHLMLGGIHTTESFGLSPVRLAVIQTDGAYEAVDSLKAVLDGAVFTGRTVFDSTVDELSDVHLISSRLHRADHLCEQCRQCSLVRVCGAGYIPHRFHPSHQFLAPSIYCHDLTYLIRHIEQAVRASGDETIIEAIDSTLVPLDEPALQTTMGEQDHRSQPAMAG